MAIRKKQRFHSEVGLSAMTDIIFMLLIFFILTSTVSSEPILKIVLPKGVEEQKLPTKPIRLMLNAQGEYAINDIRGLTIDQVPGVLETEIAKNGSVPVSIHADKTVVYEKVMEMVSIANKKGAKVVLALQREQ